MTDDVARYPDGTRDVSCREAARLISFRFDRELNHDERRELSMHLMECLNCQRFEQQLKLLQQLSRQYASGAKAPDDAVS
ncbi:MAG: zf-HC2 domain-containing protein [Burkholderiales bacterium]|jgi:hypothetical protein|nr:zf-HC2 domain-containing protein [Nitrosomonadaceae bacterium]